MPILFLIVVIDLIGFGLVIPLLPFYAERFDASPQQVTMLMAVFSADVDADRADLGAIKRPGRPAARC